MTEAAFVAELLDEAKAAAEQTGFYPSVILAQWADETAWGSSYQWLNGHNPAGISPNGILADYATVADGVDAYIVTAKSSYYDSVREAFDRGAVAQAYALGSSPWAAGHYTGNGSPAGSSLVTIIEQHDLTQYDQPEPAPTPPAPVPPQPIMEAFSMFAYDPFTGGVWGTDANGDLYGYDGAVGGFGLNTHPDYHAGAEEGGPAVVGISYWGRPGAPDGVVFFTESGTIATPGGPYSTYRFQRAGEAFVPA